MKKWNINWIVVVVFSVAPFLYAAAPLPEPPAPAEAGTLIVIDSMGKERKLKKWEFVGGTRILAWLAPAGAEDKGETKPKGEKAKPPTGPEALAMREENSTDLQEGILTLIPIDRIRTVEYDNEKRMVAVRVASGEKPADDVLISGTTKYQLVNKLTIKADVKILDEDAEVTFFGGTGDKPIKAVRFPAPKPPTAEPAGRPAFVVVPGKNNVQKVADLQPLYQLPNGSERLLPHMLFKKTLKIDVAKIQKITAVEGNAPDGKEMDVVLKDGDSDTLTLLKTVTLDGKQADLVGLLGRTPAGYKLFPIHTFTEIQFDEYKETKPEKKEDKPEKKEDKKDQEKP